MLPKQHPPLSRIGNGSEKGLDRVGIEFDTGQVPDHLGAFAACDLPLAGAGIAFPVVEIGHGDDPAADGDVYALQPLGIPAAVPVFMVVEDDLPDLGKGRDVLHHAGPGLTVAPVGSPFPDVEIGISGQNDVGDGQLSDIVEQGSGLDAVHLAEGQSHLDGCGSGIVGHLLAVEEETVAFQLQQLQEPLYNFRIIRIRGKIQELGNGDHGNSTFA